MIDDAVFAWALAEALAGRLRRKQPDQMWPLLVYALPEPVEIDGDQWRAMGIDNDDELRALAAGDFRAWLRVPRLAYPSRSLVGGTTRKYGVHMTDDQVLAWAVAARIEQRLFTASEVPLIRKLYDDLDITGASLMYRLTETTRIAIATAPGRSFGALDYRWVGIENDAELLAVIAGDYAAWWAVVRSVARSRKLVTHVLERLRA